MHKFKILILLFSSIMLTSCNLKADDPRTVADKYWQYLQTGNVAEAEKLLSANSYQIFSEHLNRITANTELENSEAKTLVKTTITTVNPETGASHTATFNTVLIQQQGQWKIDVSQTTIPPEASTQEEKKKQLAEEFTDSMQENIDSIDNAVNEGMQMLNEVLRDGSKEMGASLLELMNELNSTMQQSIDKMMQRREEQEQEPQPSPAPDPQQGEGMI